MPGSDDRLSASPAFRTAVPETAAEQRSSGDVAGIRPPVEPAPVPSAPEADRVPEPPRHPSTVLGGGPRDDEQDAEPALDRPGAPLLAGAAIAGALLVIAPFTVIAGASTVSLDNAAQQLPLTNLLGGGDGDGGTGQGTGDGAPGGGEGTDGSPVTEGAADPGFVPEVRSGSADPSLPDPGTVGGTGSVETSAPATSAGTSQSPTAPQDTPETEDAQGAAEGSQSSESSQSTASSAGEENPSSAEAGETESDASTEAASEGTDTADGEAFSTDGVAPPESPQGATDPQESSSILQDATAQTVAVDDRYLALAGPECSASEGSSYSGEGRWESSEGAASWATRPGGYGQENCQGSYEAIPVSGDPEQGDHQFAAWAFTPGEEGAVCEIYVHVPDDESPLWVASGEARYRIHPGSDTTEPAVAVFGLDQSEAAGGWVQVTGFVSPAEAFTVRLTNAGEDPFPDDEHTNAHVAASAMRADCS